MWIVFGTRTRTELVPDGLRVERTCELCGERATFYERRVARTFTLYFIPVFDTRRERVLACGACGALFKTDEHGASDAVTRSSWEDALSQAGAQAREAMDHAAGAIAPAAQTAARVAAHALSSVGDALSPALRRAGGGLGEAIARLRGEASTRARVDPEPDHDAPEIEDPEKADLLRRFAELEKKHRGG